MVKVGDKIRVLVDGADRASVRRGDKFVVRRILNSVYIEVEGEYKWRFHHDSYEVIESEPPQKITQNGYEYSLVGPVQPEWLVDGAWVVSRSTGILYKVIHTGNDRFCAMNGDGSYNCGPITASGFIRAYRLHEPSDYKWGDWAMYMGKKVFVVDDGPDCDGDIGVSGKGIGIGSTNLRHVTPDKLTPAF